MRAILLQKDDYGLQKDRLHGRYGLTGKPTITQTSIAGSLGTSFSAGQEVTLTNLRSLTAKIKEAQAAMTGTTANISDIADNIQKTNEASGEVSKILNNNTWKRFWEGQISPQQFYAIKYYEDESNERMLGEPGFPCLNIAQYPCILPRTPFWDDIFEIRNHKIAADEATDDDLCFINQDGDLPIKIKASISAQKISALFNIIGSSFYVIDSILVLLGVLNSEYFSDEALIQIAKVTAALGLIYIVKAILEDFLFNGDITELGGKKGRGANYLANKSSLFTFQNWYEIVMLDPNAEIVLQSAVASIGSIIGALGTSIALSALGAALELNPITHGIGQALKAAGSAVGRYASYMIDYLIYPAIIAALCYVIGGITTRSPGEDPDSPLSNKIGAKFANYSDEVDPPSYKNKLYTSYGTAGQFVFADSNKFISLLSNFQSLITSTLGKLFSWLLRERYILGCSGYDSNSSEIRIYNYLPFREATDVVLQDRWGISTPVARWQYNLPNFQASGGGSYNDGKLILEQSGSGKKYLSIKARVYNGNIYKIKAFDGHTITSTVVLKSHMLADKAVSGHQWEYFSELALVALDGDNEHLYLHHERNAIYNVGSVQLGKSDPTHIEQSFWNFDFKAGHSKMISNRVGAYNYAFIDFADGVKLQYRPLTEEPKENMLSGELINTEYKYENYYFATLEDFSASQIGGLQSYANVKNR